jgi:hypothetical protein
LNFFFTGDVKCFYSILVRLLSGAWWWIHFLLTVTASRRSVTLFKTAVQQALTDCKTVALDCPVSCLGNHRGQSLRIPSQSWMIPWAEPWLMCRWCATSSIVIHQLSRIMVRTHSTFSSAMDVAGRPDHSSAMTIVLPFLSMVIHSYTLNCCSKTLFQYCAESLQLISAPGTSSAHKNRITARSLLWCILKAERPC